MAFLRSLLIWMAIAVLTLVLFATMLPTALVALPFDRKRNTAHWFARLWARSMLHVYPGWNVSVEGAERLREIGGDGASVICANHESMADIIALYYLGHPFKWISKREVFYAPLIGIAMILAGYIPLKRGDKESIRRCMAKAREWLGRGVSIMMFPEGTRSLDGRVKPFKEGAFRMSLDAGVPIVPVAIHGPRDLLAKGSWLFAPRARIVVRVGPVIRPRPGVNDPAEADRLRGETRAWIVGALAEMKARPIEEVDATAAPALSPEKFEQGGNTARHSAV